MSNKLRKNLAEARMQCFTSEAVRFDPAVAVNSYTNEVDALLTEVFDSHISDQAQKTSLIALGGYGRKELCPYSDFDILILHEGDHKGENIARMVRTLWDLGLPLGCVVRSVGECRAILGEDLATDTALLEARYLAGNKSLFYKLQNSVVTPYFRKRKKWFLGEMFAAIRDGLFSADSSLYLVEPNLKNGICALRDCQRLFWSIKVAEHDIRRDPRELLPFSQKDSTQFIGAYNTLLSIRCALHCVSGRRLDILELAYQGPVAEFLGMGPKGSCISDGEVF